MQRTALLLAMCLLVGALAAQAQTADAKTTYTQKCAMCHGADGTGNTAMGKKMALRDLTSPEVQKQTDDQLNAVIANGKGKMPAYEKQLGTERIKAMVGYMRELAKK
jgi:cytochrome c6